jgi:hypothetical protein
MQSDTGTNANGMSSKVANGFRVGKVVDSLGCRLQGIIDVFSIDQDRTAGGRGSIQKTAKGCRSSRPKSAQC